MSLIELHDVRKNFGPLEVLRGVSLCIHEGEIVAVIGPSGSGKSTMLRCLNGLEKIQGGRIVVDGTVVSAPGADLIGLRQRVGMVFQSFNLFPHLTVERNVTLALTVAKKMHVGAAGEIAREVLGRVGLADKLLAYPEELSGGQQQRVAIARSLAMRPKVMLFDEITSALDPELVGEVLRVIRSLAEEGRTMLLVTHELGFAYHVANRVLFIAEGTIHEQGTPDRVLKQPTQPRTQAFLQRHREFDF
jgi:polar amino acid transport system ATP-binding protein